jgi:hypothetical protein
MTPVAGSGGSNVDASGGGSTGGASSGGANTSGGSGGNGAAGAPNPGPGIELAGALHGHCRTQLCGPDLGDGKSCQLTSDQLRTEVFSFGGDAGTTYDVTLRIRGLVEPRRYTGGMLQDPETSGWFYVGGEPDNQTANSGHLYGILKIDVSDPPQHYFFNRDSQGYSDDQTANHELYVLNELGTIRVRGGATVGVVNDDAEGSGMIRNHRNLSVEGVPGECVEQPWDGQFFYIEVESVSVAQ